MAEALDRNVASELDHLVVNTHTQNKNGTARGSRQRHCKQLNADWCRPASVTTADRARRAAVAPSRSVGGGATETGDGGGAELGPRAHSGPATADDNNKTT
ncbi:hypothetical protein Zmor_012516 [Zophobas morio]|uniref:Uncharacterized protein n=1 Tax=Zophobas morio TaxID=2755281 RepID=A0AA38MDR2_9CUCU|nr:hypothetical protein Zmor_012516 [Zophobas morio]